MKAIATDVRSQISGANELMKRMRRIREQVDAGIDDSACGYHSREIVVTDGEVIHDIIKSAQDYKCDLIVMGTKEGFLSHNSIGSTIKRVIRQTKIPVMVVPPVDETDSDK